MGVHSRASDDRLIVFAGDIHGQWSRLSEMLRRVQRVHGPIDAVLAVGDVQAVRTPLEHQMVRTGKGHEHEYGDFPEVVQGRIALPAPVFFIGGNHEPWEALDAHGPGEWGPNVHYLGRSGVAEIAGLSVAYLSGIYSPKVSEAAGPRLDKRSRTYWNQQDLRPLLERSAPVDVFLSHDWPDTVTAYGGRQINYKDGNRTISELARRLQPKILAAGHHHRRVRQVMSARTTVMALPGVAQGLEAVAPVAVNGSGELRELEALRPATFGLV